MRCYGSLYITLSILFIIFLIFINYIICSCNNTNELDIKNNFKKHIRKHIREPFGNNFTYGTDADKNTSKYLFVCVDENGNLNQYYVPGDGSAWSNAVNYANRVPGYDQPTFIIAINRNSTWAQSGTSNPVPGILCTDNNDNGIFNNISLNPNGTSDDANSFGGGTNSRESVLNLQPLDITADNFINNCTKESWYLFREQSGRHFIYAVFKRNSWISDLTCCSDSTIQRNGCNDNYVNFNGNQCSQYMQTYCNTGSNITNTKCRTWCTNNNNKDNCKIYKNTYCNNSNNISNSYSFCRDWCKTPDSNKACDTGIVTYCDNNLSNLDLCACMQKNNMYAATQTTNNDPVLEKLKPICYSKKCAENGYITSAMTTLATTCPRCYQSIEIQKLQAGGKIDLNNFVQSCELTNNNIDTTSTPTLNPISIQKTPPNTTTQLSKADLYKQKLRSICTIL